MGDLSKNFSRSEFACKCGCGFDGVDAELLKVLQDVRDHGGKSIRINSGCRCLEYNRSIGSKDTSQHVKAKAADIIVIDVPASKVQKYLKTMYQHKYGIGCYQYFTHIDVRATKARW